VDFADNKERANPVAWTGGAIQSLGNNRFSQTFTAPGSINATNKCVLVSFAPPSGSSWDLTGVQLEPGSVATPFEHRPIGLELQLCQRYFQKYDTIKLSVDTHEPSTATHANAIVPRTVTMRAAPTTENGTEGNITGLSFNASAEVINARGRITDKSAGSFVNNYTADAEL